MKNPLIRQALTLISLASAAYAGLFIAVTTHAQQSGATLADAGMCQDPAMTSPQGPSYFVGCGGFF